MSDPCPEQQVAASRTDVSVMTALPLDIEAQCPRCQETVRVSLRSIGAVVEANKPLVVTPEYAGYHRCQDLPT